MMADMVSALRVVWAELGLSPVSQDHLPTYEYAGPTLPSVHLHLTEESIQGMISRMGLRNFAKEFDSFKSASDAAAAAAASEAPLKFKAQRHTTHASRQEALASM